MAQLVAADYRELRKQCFTVGLGKEELKALAGGMPSESQLMAAFQYLEDQTVSGFAALKSGMDTELGKTTTNAGAQKMMAAYYIWKAKNILG
jgi:hypothetical protein